jgi:hypothetical protein
MLLLCMESGAFWCQPLNLVDRSADRSEGLMNPRGVTDSVTAVRRIVSSIWGVILLGWTVAAGFIGLVGINLYLGDNPCALGDNPCTGTTALRIIGWAFSVFAVPAVITSFLASLAYFIYAVRLDRSSLRTAGRLLLFAAALTVAAIGVVIVGRVLHDAFGVDLDGPHRN